MTGHKATHFCQGHSFGRLTVSRGREGWRVNPWTLRATILWDALTSHCRVADHIMMRDLRYGGSHANIQCLNETGTRELREYVSLLVIFGSTCLGPGPALSLIPHHRQPLAPGASSFSSLLPSFLILCLPFYFYPGHCSISPDLARSYYLYHHLPPWLPPRLPTICIATPRCRRATSRPSGPTARWNTATYSTSCHSNVKAVMGKFSHLV